MDVLAQFGFSCSIIGVQPFDKERGIAVAVDLIYAMDTLKAGAIFARDLLGIDFDMVSLYHSYFARCVNFQWV